jgi:hypothetical protein
LIDMTTQQELARLENPFQERAINCLCFSPDGTSLVGIIEKASLHVWDLRAIRRELLALDKDLDWDQPPYPAADEK